MAYISPNIQPSGMTWSQYQAKGAAGHLEMLIAGNLTGTLAPTAAPTVSATGGGSSGGALAAGVYLLRITETNGIGETTASPESDPFTVAAGDIPTVTFPTLQTGNTARSVYLTPAGGASGSELLYADGITGGTFNLSVATPSNSFAVPPPTANSTGLTWPNAQGVTMNQPLEYIRMAKSGRLQNLWNDLRDNATNFLSGNPVAWNAMIQKKRHVNTAFAFFATLAAEEGALLDANPGHFVTTQTGIQMAATERVWP